MRCHGIFLVSAAVALAAFGLVEGQPPGGKDRFAGAPDPLILLRNPQVKKELELTEAQAQALTPAVMRAVAGVLNDTQMKRLRQIRLQAMGNGAFSDGKVRKGLKLNQEQIKGIEAIFADAQKEREEILKPGPGGKGTRAKLEGVSKETHAKIMQVLDAAQQKAWKQMRGAEFNPAPPRGPEK